MKIVDSSIGMQSKSTLQQTEVYQESLRSWGQETGTAGPPSETKPNTELTVEISQKAKEFYTQTQQTIQINKSDSLFYLDDADKQKLLLLHTLMEAITGKKLKFKLPVEDDDRQAVSIKLSPEAIARVKNQQPVQLQGWGLDYHAYHAYQEKETVSFSAAGVVKTADGKEIDVSLALKMSRQFTSEQRLDIKAGDALVDPLVINFDAPAARLTQTKFSFDLDSDGTADQISFAGPGSGFLTLDLNNDGKVNNGKELFGPNTGNGFAELADYDSDKNGWIDENDPVYEKLRIWTKDAEGKDQLLALGQKGVGAIYLGAVGTEMSFKDSQNNQQGQLRQTGIFLRENGTAGTVQQVDLVV